MSLLTPIEAPPSLTEQAVAALRRDILSTRLAPGETISEAGAAQRLEMGKAPIRAALARLAEDGLVQAVPRRGWMVSLVTIRDIHEVFDLRLLLEPEAARRAAGRVDTTMLARLDAVCAEGYDCGDAESAMCYLDANKRFHVAIAELSGNGRLARQLDRMLDESTRMLVLGLRRRDRTMEMAHEHHELVERLALGQGEAAAALMHEQVAASREMVLAALTAPDAMTAV
ncbi:GntR family transcriptional regulator [Roseococcus suduntuyensis]|uniref:DNA-binding GntR family transcriptional regulator n=1 Tax=Roseococcus suduntuyensis TaxID=455361 RepID=A0A840AFX9_9PROT|nr:GntR family transcriptional regulator [Roseococcus suduntuyensis]MBB3899005.1 DNA-binding GntR family transcriptional regulator [Roseococcus suduntuyensis]